MLERRDISTSPTVPVRGAASRQVSPRDAGAAHRQSSTGCARLIARPSGTRGTAARKCGQRRGDRRFDSRRRGRDRPTASARDRGRRSAATRRRRASRAVRQLLDRDRSRLEKPAQVGGQVGDCRFEEHPAARPRTCDAAASAAPGSASGGGAASSGPSSASESMCCAADNALRLWQRAPPPPRRRGWPPRRRARRAWRRPAGVAAPDLGNAIASLSARQARAALVSARPWFRSADSQPASRRCRP